ncbi:autotransporter-associated beta strand repeat-containing protein [Verrucomicrobiota bacterium sgz303538]
MTAPRILSKSISSLVVLGAIAAAQPFVPSTAQAATYTWAQTAAGTFDWDSAASNWTAGFPNAAGDVVNLTANLAGAQTINLNQAITLGSLTIGDPTAGYFAYTIAPNGGSLIFSNNGTGATLATSNVATGVTNSITANVTLADNLTANIQNTNALSISGNLTESGGSRILGKTGSGTLTLSGVNTYSGGTTVTGIINAASNTALGTGSVTINNAAGNQLQLANGVNISNPLTINGGGATSQGVVYVPTGNATYSGNINITAVQSAGGHFATAANTSVLTVSGNITAASSAFPVSVRAGTVVFSGANSYTGGTSTITADSRAMIQFAKTASMPTSGTVTILGGTSLAVNVGGSGEFTTGTGAGTIGGLLAGIGTSGTAGSVSLAANSSLGIDTTNATGKVTFTDAFTSTNNVGLLKLGTGTLELTNGGTYTGIGAAAFPLVVRQATLLLNGGTHTANGEVVIGGTFGTANGAAGYDAKLQVDSGTLTTTGFLSVGRGNGIGGVSSDLVANNAAIINAANVSAGYNANSTANLPKSTITLNNTSAFNVTGANAVVNIAESAGSNITMALNDSAVFNAGDTQVRIGQGGTASLTLNGSSNFNHGATNRLLTVGTNAGSYGTVTLNGTSTFTHTANITSIGEAGTGVFNIASNTATANVRNLVIGRASGGIGAVYNKGSIQGISADGIFMGDGANSASYFRNDNGTAATENAVATNIHLGVANGSVVVLDVISGTIGGNTVVTGRDGNANSTHGQFNIIGGVFNAGAGGFTVANNTGATNKWGNVNVTGGTFNSAGAINLSLGNSATNTGILSVKTGGTVVTDTITAGGTASNTFINFDGGVLQASGATASLVSGNIDQLTVHSGGVTVDTNFFNKSIDTVIAAPAGNGVTGITLSGAGTGYEGRPIVKITGDGTGATAVADFDPVTGQVTGVTIVNPGTGYTTATATILGGGGTALTATTTLGSVSGGGLAKIGGGTLTLTAPNTYTGVTNVNAGALALANTTGSATGTGAVNVKDGATLTGAGISSGLTTIASGGTIVPGNSGIGTLTLGSLTLNTGTFLDYEITDAGSRDLITVTNSAGLTINGGTFRLYQPGTTMAFDTNGVYNLIGYTGVLGGTGISALSVDASTTATGKAYTFGTAGGFVTLTIANAGVTPNFWNVNADGNWTTGTNWTLNSAPNGAGAVANFGGGGATITAPRTVTLNANQTVGSIGFNSAQSYTISGANTLTLNNGTDPVAQITNAQGTHTLGVALNAVSPTTQFTVLTAADTLTVSGPLSGTTNLIKNGEGTLNLTATNSYVGNTTLSSGTLALSGAGTLGNTANALMVSGGTLNLGGTTQTTGALTISGGTLSNGTLKPASLSSTGTGTSTISANITGAIGVTQDGTGTLKLAGNNSYTGDTVVNAGAVAISSLNSLGSATNSLVFNGGALQVDGTSVANLGTHALVGFPSAINLTDSGNTFTFTDITAFGTLVKQGAGKLVMNGTNTFDSFASPSVQGGTLEITGSFTGGDGNGGIEIAPNTGSSATLSVVPGATVNTGRVIIGGNTANTSGGSGTLIQTGGTINARQWFTVGSGTNSANTGASGVFTMTGGVLNASTSGTQNMEIANFTGATGVVTISGSSAINLYNNAAIAMGANNNAGSATFNQDGGTVTFFSDGGATQGGTGGLRLGNAATLPASSTFTYNLNGGTLATPSISRNTGSGNVSGRIFNFNGGTLKATASSATFIANTITTNVKAGSAKIDTNGFDVTIPAVLAHDAALGATADGGLIKDGAGTLTLSGANSFTGNIQVNAGTLVASNGVVGNPVTSALGNNTIAGRTVTIDSGATLSFGVNDVFGNQTAVPGSLPTFVVNGGTLNTNRYNQIGAITLNGARLTSNNTTDQGNYQNFQFLGDITVGGSAPSYISSSSAAGFDGNHLSAATRFNVAEVTGDVSADLTVSAPLRNQSGNYGNAAGGLVKDGTGTMLLTGANTYTGTTAVNAGALITTPAQTGATTVNVAAGATFGVKLATAGTTFNIGALNSGATLLFDTGTLGNPTVPVISATTFTPIAATVLNVTGTALTIGNDIPLLDYTGSIGGVGFAGLSLTLPPRTVGNLVNNTIDTRIDLNITQFEQVKWKGSVNGNWDADTDGTGTNGTQNWVTTVTNAATKYLQGTGGTDTVNFDDSATGTPNINIATAVSPLGTNFNNSSLNYTISSTSGFGIGGSGLLTKSGTGSLTLNTPNTYTGGTTLNTGKLVLNNASAIGTGTLTINGGTLDTASATVLSTNNAQNWNGDFTFTGTKDLDMGTGAVTVGGTGTDRVLTVNNGTLTVGEIKAAAQGLNKQGGGTLVVTSVGNDVTGSTIAGTLNVGGGTLQINRTGTNAAASGDLTVGGLTGSGTVMNGAATERWLFVNTTGTVGFSGTLANGNTGALGFNKQGTGTQTLSGTNSYTGATTVNGGTLVLKGTNTGAGTNATVNAGNLVLANTSALGGSSLVRMAGDNVSTLTFSTDNDDNVYAFTQGTTTNSTVVSDRATPGAGINHTLTTQSGANGVGGGMITFTSGANVTSGTGRITLPYFGLGAGTVQTTVLNPTTANVSVGDISKANNNVSQTIELGGTSQDNEVTGGISNGSVLTGANNVSLVKSGTSKWTLSGFNYYTGTTTVNDGALLVQGSISGSTAVSVNSGTLGGTGSVDSLLNLGNGIGTKDATLAPGIGIGTLFNMLGVNFGSDAVFALEIDTNTLTTDLLSSNGPVSLGLGVAALNVTNLGSAAIKSGQTFTFISGAGGVTGEFAGLHDGTVFGVGANFFEINYTPTSVELIAVPEPASTALLLTGGAFLGLRRKRRRTA